LSVPTKATTSRGQKSSNPAKAIPVSAIRAAAPISSLRGAVGVEPYEKRQEGRTGERRGRDHAGLERAVAELEEIDRQQQAHETVADRPQAARGEQEARLGRAAGGQDPGPSAHGAARGPRRQAIAPAARK
jgi:hypothetical protein